MKPGYIRITDKIYFEYYELPLKVKDFCKTKLETLAKHCASKQLVEVSNKLNHGKGNKKNRTNIQF